MMKGVYSAVLIAAVALVVLVFSVSSAPDTLTVGGIEYQLVRESHGTALYTPGGASEVSARSRLRLVRAESNEIDAMAAMEKKMIAQGATRIGDGRFWHKKDQTRAHISIALAPESVVVLSLIETVSRTDSSLYSAETFRQLELVAPTIPGRARWFPTLF